MGLIIFHLFIHNIVVYIYIRIDINEIRKLKNSITKKWPKAKKDIIVHLSYFNILYNSFFKVFLF